MKKTLLLLFVCLFVGISHAQAQVTVQRTLAELMETDEITKIGGGRYTKYTWNNK